MCYRLFIDRMKVSPNARLLDLIISMGLVLLSVLLAVLLHLNFLTTTVLFFGVPSLYLICRDPSHLKKATVAGLLFGVVWVFTFYTKQALTLCSPRSIQKLTELGGAFRIRIHSMRFDICYL
jgi:hypothetical protein